uniref:Claudin n=1 Tax=Eptatretus burgeri TaxID=7764 RepID=A0A8C4N7E6_EPTBU
MSACCGPCVLSCCFVLIVASVAALIGALVSPTWRSWQLGEFGTESPKLVIVYEGLWSRCVGYDSGDCIVDDPLWPRVTDRLDMRLLQLLLPLAAFAAFLASLLNIVGLCLVCNSQKAPTAADHSAPSCSTNPAAFQILAAILLALATVLGLPPTIWAVLGGVGGPQALPAGGAGWWNGYAIYLALGALAGCFVTSAVLAFWYCTCRPLPMSYNVVPSWYPLQVIPSTWQPPPSSVGYATSRTSNIGTDHGRPRRGWFRWVLKQD